MDHDTFIRIMTNSSDNSQLERQESSPLERQETEKYRALEMGINDSYVNGLNDEKELWVKFACAVLSGVSSCETMGDQQCVTFSRICADKMIEIYKKRFGYE